MRKMLKLITLLAALMLPAMALSDPLTLTEDLSGRLYWPEGTDADTAVYTYSYRYPQVAGEGETESTINALYAYQVSDAEAFTLHINGEQIMDPTLPASTVVDYRITANTDDWFCVLFTKTDEADGVRQVIYSAQTFSRNTLKPGNVITLPYLLGILREDETDEWLKDRQTNRANDCVRGLVRDEIARRCAGGNSQLGALGDEDLEYAFYPEEDYYYDGEADQIVFFLQPYLCEADELSNDFLFPFTLEEILDEL